MLALSARLLPPLPTQLSADCTVTGPARCCLQVEALAQLRCVDSGSAGPVVGLAVATARRLEEGRHLELSQLAHLARVMNGVAVIASGWGGLGWLGC